MGEGLIRFEGTELAPSFQCLGFTIRNQDRSMCTCRVAGRSLTVMAPKIKDMIPFTEHHVNNKRNKRP